MQNKRKYRVCCCCSIAWETSLSFVGYNNNCMTIISTTENEDALSFSVHSKQKKPPKKKTQPEKRQRKKKKCLCKLQMLCHSKGGTIAGPTFLPHEFHVHFQSILFLTRHNVAVFVFSVRLWLLFCWCFVDCVHCSHYLKLLSFVCAQNAVVKNLFIFRLFLFSSGILAFSWPYLFALTTTTAAAATVKIRVENGNGESFVPQHIYRMKAAPATEKMKRQRKNIEFICRCLKHKIYRKSVTNGGTRRAKYSNGFRNYLFVWAIPTAYDGKHISITIIAISHHVTYSFLTENPPPKVVLSRTQANLVMKISRSSEHLLILFSLHRWDTKKQHRNEYIYIINRYFFE